MKYGVGLDIGITSVGYAVLELDEQEQPCQIIRLGCRMFEAAENAQNGSSLAAPRREKRSQRRRLRRRRHRLERIRQLIVNRGLLTQQELDGLFTGKLPDIYALRVRALDEPVTNAELARIWIHLAQRRGFRSNRRSAAGGDDGKLKAAVEANRARMAEKGYRTCAEMYLLDPVYAESKRNHRQAYLGTVERAMVEAEARAIFQAQRALGNPAADEETEEAYLAILLSQRSFEDGPGGDSPYGGPQIEKMVGQCTLLPDQPRAAKASYSFEYFRLLQQVNHIRIRSGGTERALTPEERQAVVQLQLSQKDVSYAAIRKLLGLSAEQSFVNVRPRAAKPGKRGGAQEAETREAAEKREKLCCMAAYHEMRGAMERVEHGAFARLTAAQRNAIGYILSVYKTDATAKAKLMEAGLSEPLAEALAALTFSGFGHLSVAACKRIIPYLEEGAVYSAACEKAGLAFRAHEQERSMYLPKYTEEMEDLTSPVVRRAVSQTIKVLNAIIREQGASPLYVNLELAREMSKPFRERKEAERQIAENNARNNRLMDELRELGIRNPKGQDLVKYRLWKEQDCRCAYTGRHIPLESLFAPGYAEVDHIVPYSLSFDDSYRNKVLVLAAENREKGNRLPLQYMGAAQASAFRASVLAEGAPPGLATKRANLLREQLTDEDLTRFRARNLQDTQTMSRFLLNYIQDHLCFAPSATGKKKRVTAVNGRITAFLRKRWGLEKDRSAGDKHHAQDAVVIACTTDALIQRVSRFYKSQESRYAAFDEMLVDPATGELLARFPQPWPDFRAELTMRMSSNPADALRGHPIASYAGRLPESVAPIFISRMSNHKVKGPAHQETNRATRQDAPGQLVTRTPLTALKLKDGEIKDYYNPRSDLLLYAALKARLEACGGNAKQAFAEPFYKPKADGTPGPLVRTVRTQSPSGLNIPVLQGMARAENSPMVRVDVYHVEGEGYYWVPVYVSDTLKPSLPDRAVVKNKPYDQWKRMADENFLFSLYKRDLVRLRHKGEEPQLLYFVSGDIATGVLTFINHDNSEKFRLGAKTLQSLEKYEVDLLGNVRPAGREARRDFSRLRR